MSVYISNLLALAEEYSHVKVVKELSSQIRTHLANMFVLEDYNKSSLNEALIIKEHCETLKFFLITNGADVSQLRNTEEPTLQEKYDALREAAIRMQLCVGNLLANGARDSTHWFDTITEAQQYLSSHTNATRDEFAASRLKFDIPDAVTD